MNFIIKPSGISHWSFYLNASIYNQFDLFIHKYFPDNFSFTSNIFGFSAINLIIW